MAWWLVNRQSAPGLLTTELDETLMRILSSPTIGEIVRSTRLSSVRRRLMRRTRYYVYYRMLDDDIEVVAFWHASRGTPPPI
jgi:plasmid stabilization system protein ParE